MPVETAQDLAVFFNPDEFGVSADYFAPGSAVAQPCTLLLSKQDRELSGMRGRQIAIGTVLSFLKSAVPTPVKDGEFETDTETLRILSDPKTDDLDRDVWVCTATVVDIDTIPEGALLWHGQVLLWHGRALTWRP